jgi:tetratricopeptide (TPR) repeat protein
MYKGVSLTILALAAMVLSLAGPGCHSTQVSSGILYQNQNNHQKAVRMFREALLYNDEEAAAHYQLAWSLSILAKDDDFNGTLDSARVRLAEAHEHYLLAKQYDPEEYDVTPERDHSPAEDAIASNYSHWFNKAVKYNEAGQPEQAAVYFDLAYVSDPRGERGFNARISYLKLEMNEATENEDEAGMLAVLEELDRVEAPNVEAQADLVNTKALVLNNLGRRAEAAQLYEQLLADNPEDIALLGKVADARRESGDLEGAGELMVRIVAVVDADTEMERADRLAHYLTAMYLYYDAEQYPRCIEVGQKALPLTITNDERASIWRRVTRAHYELEDWDRAVEGSEKLVNELDPENPSVWQIYYLSLDKAGRRDEAIQARERFLQLRE